MILQKQIEELEAKFTKELSELKALAKKEEEFKVGDWVKIVDNGSGFTTHSDGHKWPEYNRGNNLANDSIGKIMEFTMLGGYRPAAVLKSGEHIYLIGTETSDDNKYPYIKATPSEIEKHLISEAEKKGFVKGAKVKYKLGELTIESFELITEERSSKGCIEYFRENGIHLSVNKGCVAWPLPLCELLPSCPQITINGYKAEFKDYSIQFGCKSLPKSLFLELNQSYNDFENRGVIIEAIKIFCEGDHFEVKREQIKEIANHYKSK